MLQRRIASLGESQLYSGEWSPRVEIILLLVLVAVSAVVSGVVARRKRRRVWLWVLLGAVFPVAALFIVAVLPASRAGGASLAAALDHESRLRALAEGAKLRRRVDEARAEAARHRPRFGGF